MKKTTKPQRAETNAQPKDQLQVLLETVEVLRREMHPQMDPSLVRDILKLHADSASTDVELSRGVEQLVEQRLKEK
jgi:hypothetical protein